MVSFEQSEYSVNESSGSVQLMLILNISSSIDITVRVIDIHATALGKEPSLPSLINQ